MVRSLMNYLSPRRVAMSVLLMLVAACSTPSVENAQTDLARYVRIIIPANGIEGQTYTEVARVEFALNTAGQVIMLNATDPVTGEVTRVPQIARVHYNSTFSAPGALQLAGIVLPGLIQVAGQYALQERCINAGCGGGGTVIQNINDINATGNGTAEVFIPGTTIPCVTCRQQ